MVKKMVVSAVVVLFIAAYVGAQQADAPKPDQITVVGMVQKTVDAEGKLTAVKVVAPKGTYDVTLDANGIKLADLDGKKAQVKGTVAEVDGKKVLTVASFKEVAAPPAK